MKGKIKLETINRIISASVCCSKNDTRRNMHYVYFTPVRDHVKVEASNGFILTSTVIFDDGLFKLVNTGRLHALCKHNIALLKKSRPKKSMLLFEYDFTVTENGEIILWDTVLKPKNPGTPCFSKVIPNVNDYESVTSFNAEFLARLVKACDKRGPLNVSLKLRKDRRKTAPLLIDIDTDTTSVLMPVKIKTEEENNE